MSQEQSSNKLTISEDTFIKFFGKDANGSYTSITLRSPKEYAMFLISDIDKIYIRMCNTKCAIVFKTKNDREFDIVELTIHYNENSVGALYSGGRSLSSTLEQIVEVSIDHVTDSARKNTNLIFPSSQATGLYPHINKYDKIDKNSAEHNRVFNSVKEAIFNYLDKRYLTPIMDFMTEADISINTIAALENVDD